MLSTDMPAVVPRALVFGCALSALLCGALAASAETGPCTAGVSRETAERLFAALNHPPAEAECKFEGVDSDGTRLEARWSRGGRALPPIHVAPRQCAPAGTRIAGAFAIDVPSEITASCPSVAPLIDECVSQLAEERPAGEGGSERDPLFRITRALFSAIVVVALSLAVRGVRRRASVDRVGLVTATAAFCAAFAVRCALPFSLGNWYSEVLPAAGPPPWMRFGPGVFAFQSLLRDAGIWSSRALVVSQLLLGAASGPLLFGVLRELRIGLVASAATLVLFILAPFHARLSATSSEHVLAATLCLGLLFAWLRAARTGDWLWLILAMLLFPAVCATRIDMAVQAFLVLLWPLLRDRVERESAPPAPALAWRSAALALVAAVTLGAAYGLIAIPSHHPLPDAREQMLALRSSLEQFWLLATHDPAWMSLSAVLLAIIGAAVTALRRPLLLIRAAMTLFVPFAALGRLFIPDELLAARYFLFTIAIFLIVSGLGYEALLALVPARQRSAAAAIGLVALALWTGLAGRQAYAARYAFQDEYTFARSALAQLPAGCVVYQVPIRSDRFARDLDCCLDLRRSPLVLDFPHLQFRDLPDALSTVERTECAAYYESIACEIADDPNDPTVHAAAERAAPYLQQRCAEVRRVGQLQPLAATITSARATVHFFRNGYPHARLYRWSF